MSPQPRCTSGLAPARPKLVVADIFAATSIAIIANGTPRATCCPCPLLGHDQEEFALPINGRKNRQPPSPRVNSLHRID
jgi:hypothetical protein